MGGAPLAGLVLCGGAGSRMGRDKASIMVRGIPMVVRMAAMLSTVADPVILAPGRPGRLGPLGYPEVADDRPSAGPLAGLVAGLASSPHGLVAVVAVDMPFANPELLAMLAGLHRDEDAVVPVTATGPQPLHAVYATSALPALRLALDQGRLSMAATMEGLTVRRVPERAWRRADSTGRFAVNLNRPEDLGVLD